MHNWRFLVIALLAAVQTVACFSERASPDGRQCSQRDAAEVFPSIRHSYDRRKFGDRQALNFRLQPHRDDSRYEIRDHRLSQLRTSADRTREAFRYSTYSDSDTERQLLRTHSERIGAERGNNYGRSERFRSLSMLSERRRFEVSARTTPVRQHRGDYERRQDSRRDGVLPQTRSIRVTHGRDSRRSVEPGREIRNDFLRSEATRRQQRSDSALERREVTATRASLTRGGTDEKLHRLDGGTRASRDRTAANDRDSRRVSVRDRSYSLPSNRMVEVVRRDRSTSSGDEARTRDVFRQRSKPVSDRRLSRSTERASEREERQTNIPSVRVMERSRLTRDQSIIRSTRTTLDVRRNDLTRERARVVRNGPQRDSRISERDIRSTSSRDARQDGSPDNKNSRFTDRTDTRRARTASLTRADALERSRIDTRYRSHPELNRVETRRTQHRTVAMNRSKDAETVESQFLAENWKALAFYTLQGLYLCSVLFRVFGSADAEKKKTRLPNWWPMARRAIKQD